MHQETYYPRALVINGDAINQGLGTGVTVGNLFGGWPKDKLAQLYLNRNEIDGAVRCSKTWRLEFVKDRLPGFRSATRYRRVVPMQSSMKQIAPAGGTVAAGNGWAPQNHRTHGAAITCIRGAIRTIFDSVPYRLSSDLLKEIHDFEPEVIYSCIGNIQLASLVNQLARLESAATVVHLMDDWLASKHTDSWIWAWHRYKLASVSRDLIKSCSAPLAISDRMAQEYATEFGRPFGVFMNCVDLNGADEPSPPISHPGAPLRFVYIGGLHFGRWQSLLQIGEALDGMGDRPPARLIVHAPAAHFASYAQGHRMPRSLEVGGPVAPAEVRSVLQRAHVTVHVESFGRAESLYMRLSISTKVPQCMSVGRPILAYGPGEGAGCQYVRASTSGVVVGRQDRRELTEGLQRLCGDADLRAKLGRQAWLTALDNHNAETVRERFRRVLAGAARETRAAAGEPARARALEGNHGSAA